MICMTTVNDPFNALSNLGAPMVSVIDIKCKIGEQEATATEKAICVMKETQDTI